MSDPQQPQNWQWPQTGGQPSGQSPPGGQWPQTGGQPGGQPPPGGQWPQTGGQPGGQPPPGGQWPQTGGQPQPGAQPWPGAQPPPGYQAPPGFPAPGYGQPVPRPRRRLLPWIIVAAVIVVGAGGYFTFHAISSTPKGSITLPRTLLSLPRATSGGASHLAGVLSREETSNSHGKLSGVKAGVYGSPTGAWLAVAGGGICGTCYAKSPSALKSGLVSSGYSNVRAFPSGPKGGALACGEKTAGSNTLLHCTWVDSKTAGDVLYAGGSASGLTDAATKTNQVRAAIER
jgi:hypothetical protein